MKLKNEGKRGLGAIALIASMMATGCSSGTTAENATTTVSAAVSSASDSTDAVEVSSLMRGMGALRSEAVEGFHCDSSPDVTYVTVCGKSLPATVHLEWTNCAAPTRPGGDGGGHGGGGGCMGGSTGSPPGSSSGSTSGGTVSNAGGTRTTAAGLSSADGHAAPGPSSGTVDVTYTYSAAEDCTGAVTQEQSVSFQISRTATDGSVAKEQGTTSSTAQLVDGAPPQQKQTHADVTRSTTDASGTVASSVHLTGSMSTAFSSDTPPSRTINGSYTEEFLDGSQGTVTLANIVRPPRSVCPWPTSGTLSRNTSDGQTHTLVFGPDCGTATLDGSAVQLPQGGGGGGPGKGGHR